MKISVLLGLILKELKIRKREFRNFLISIVSGSLCILLLSVLNLGVVEYLQQRIEQSAEYKVITIPLARTADKDKLIEYVDKMRGVTGITEYQSLYHKIDYFDIEQEEYMPMIELKFVNNHWDTFVTAEVTGEVSESIVCGRDFLPTDRKKAIIDEFSVLALGIEDCADILGKNLTIGNGDKRVTVEVVGVSALELSVDKENVGMESYDVLNRLDIGLAPVVVTMDVLEEISGEKSLEDYYMKISVDSVYQVQEICAQLEEMGIELFSGGDDFKKVIMYLDIIRDILSILAVTLLIVAMVNMIGSLYTVLEENRRWYALLQVMGYRQGNIILIVVLELLGLACMALAISAVVTMVLVGGFNYAVQDIDSATNDKMFTYPWGMLLKLFGGVIGTVTAISSGMTVLLLRKEGK